MLRISAGPITRKPRNQKRYSDYLRRTANDTCAFCDEHSKELGEIVESTKHFFVVKNIYGYTIWDGCDVIDQLVFIPRAHTDRLKTLSKQAKSSVINGLAKYENAGYSLYARAPKNITRSITHQHTNLIKLGTKRRSFLLYLRKPHILFFK